MDYRIPMTRTEFEAIPVEPGYEIENLWGRLIDGNPHNLYEVPGEELTLGQQVFIALGSFDSQVCNGGITQFFWNRAEGVTQVGEALELLHETELHELFIKALRTVLDQRGGWVRLREEAYRHPAAPDLEPFRKSYELLALGWFDEAYYEKREQNERKERVVIREGLRTPFLRRLAAWVKAHPEEFITG